MAGLSFYLNGAQVIDLVGPGARSAASLGFGEEEGYTAADSSEFSDESEGDAPAGSKSGNPEDF